MYETWYKMTQLLRSGLDVSPVLTHQFDLDDFQEAFETEHDNWFYNADSKYGIQDLGYYMGYAICKSYYDHAEKKTLAIKQIIELDHANVDEVVEFVNRSGYFEIPLEVEP